jgi:hypothetical protein
MIEPRRISRREAIRWMAAASASLSLVPLQLSGAVAAAAGYGTDPNLMEDYRPGDVWPLTFTPAQRQAAAALCDMILPADDQSPAASSVGVPDFLDEWISAPYPEQQADRKLLLDGLAWLDQESKSRFGKTFAEAADADRRRICDRICYEPETASELKAAARFFARFRDLAAGGFYTTPQGWKDLQYLGNVPLAKFDGPPPEVLAYLKLT